MSLVQIAEEYIKGELDLGLNGGTHNMTGSSSYTEPVFFQDLMTLCSITFWYQQTQFAAQLRCEFSRNL